MLEQPTGHRFLHINTSGRTHLGDVHNFTHNYHPLGEYLDIMSCYSDGVLTLVHASCRYSSFAVLHRTFPERSGLRPPRSAHRADPHETLRARC
jgi:hypothetical protein